jgi:hypothetical protein
MRQVNFVMRFNFEDHKQCSNVRRRMSSPPRPWHILGVVTTGRHNG